MKILISPAKSLDFESKIDNVEYTKPIFLDKTSEIYLAQEVQDEKYEYSMLTTTLCS